MKPAKGSRTLKFIVLAAMVANAMILIDQTAVPLALPDIVHTFSISQGDSQWVLNASLLPLASFLVLGGRMGDMFGPKKIFSIGLFAFAGASAVGGFAPTFPLLLLCRIVQGVGGALMLPTSISVVSTMVSNRNKGRILGLVGGVAAVAGAFGPTLGGVLTSVFSWRAVLLVNLPLACFAYLALRRAAPANRPAVARGHIDITGTVLLAIALTGLVFGLAQSQQLSYDAPIASVAVPLGISLLAAIGFVATERHSPNPLMSFGLLKRHPNYLGATVSQIIGGMAEMGMGILLPLFLILDLGMPPIVAGVALIPASLPMVFVAPAAGRWYDRVGGRQPLMAGFAMLSVSVGLMAAAVFADNYVWLLPGLLLYGVGLALVLATNDPVTLDTLPDERHGEASGVSATAEQFGGAIGIAGLYLIFHTSYVDKLHELIRERGLSMQISQLEHLRSTIIAAEQTGLKPDHIPAALASYLPAALSASDYGYAIAFVATSILSLIGLLAVLLLVRPAVADPQD
ncbi:MAG TPA: MFS transporter [Candidatus Saccharimonadales bacterium]|nr:MFS transporter [Candidatus Saccharimonadales bacterium]